MSILSLLFLSKKERLFREQLRNVLGFAPAKYNIYKTALSHRSVREGADENNERLEFLGDAILSSIVAHYLFMRYPYKEEGFLTEMRSKMVNRNMLNDIAVKIGLKKITLFNKYDTTLKTSQIFGNTLEALIGAVYLDKGYDNTSDWVNKQIILPHLFMQDLENLDINQKNKLFGWANKNGKTLEFETINEQQENGRRLFTIGAKIDGKIVAQAKAFNKKDASQVAAQIALEKLHIS
ncbi:MAG: ribonuclease III [Bacteroidetes bacterium]|nr:ribonuclease III [Bacteroidota bacterium]